MREETRRGMALAKQLIEEIQAAAIDETTCEYDLLQHGMGYASRWRTISAPQLDPTPIAGDPAWHRTDDPYCCRRGASKVRREGRCAHRPGRDRRHRCRGRIRLRLGQDHDLLRRQVNRNSPRPRLPTGDRYSSSSLKLGHGRGRCSPQGYSSEIVLTETRLLATSSGPINRRH
jgi:hypothetical protein